MTLSPLIMAILEKAKEPLFCLRGAGYFTEEEWVQLDLIMNKKYVWTQGHKQRFKKPRSVAHSDIGVPRTVPIEARSPKSLPDREENHSSPELLSTNFSIDPSSDDIETPNSLGDIIWSLSPALACPAPIVSYIDDQPDSCKTLKTSVLIPNYTVNQFEEVNINSSNYPDSPMSKSHAERFTESLEVKESTNPDSIPSRENSVSTWLSRMHNGSLPKLQNYQENFVTKNLLDRNEKSTLEPSLKKSEKLTKNKFADVNTFETNNAAEWDEELPRYPKEIGFRGLATTRNEKSGKTGKRIPSGPSGNRWSTMAISPIQRRIEIQKPDSAKESVYISPLPKTKTCWFWAESIKGCRYRPEECLHIHVTPKPGSLPNYPLKDGKPTWGSLADAVPIEVPTGKLPQSCWFWARWGECERGDACDYVHGWVAGGVSPEPTDVNNESKTIEIEKVVVDSSCIKETEDFHMKEFGDKASPQGRNIDPSLITSRIHTIDW
ncbi:hypothetical protein GcC1_070012 [Golovinomyces cichoracearum]|uniref:C3H1-type domain-containing protein n=1 Tax=Golovinomyces cichoracearum TaxID=62708 RepID=A0A420IQ56_9PEZI|nr:hypothetical protein GcC1_070012 [Golovinomyces cichoracearum]